MTLDKQNLQPLLWSVVASWRADSDALERHTDALDEFLGETTVDRPAGRDQPAHRPGPRRGEAAAGGGQCLTST